MGFHYGYEKRKFDAEWTRLEQEYRAAGMNDRQIAVMKEYDWTWSQSGSSRSAVQQALNFIKMAQKARKIEGTEKLPLFCWEFSYFYKHNYRGRKLK